MLLADKTVVNHNRGIQNANQFTIQQSAKMFNILSNSLYSDKVMAVIRELSTNAYDSHVASGNTDPFRVKLPTDTDPIFMVRDYGTGLSQQDMESLYTTYGASNKNTSNDFVGCLGLGSKSPFAYTKSFSTNSYFNGKKYMYVAAMDEVGVPTLNHLGTFDTDEPNGLEISFAVSRYDVREFSSKAQRVFHYFKNKPILEGSMTDHNYSRNNISVESEGWRICKLAEAGFPSHYHNMGTGIVAVMGNIAYPVDTAKIIGEKKEEDVNISRWNRTFKKADIDNWRTFLNEILNRGMFLELDFGIGELEMDPAREGLQYTKEVIKLLKERTQGIYSELKRKLSEKIANAETKIEAHKAYHMLAHVSDGWGSGATWTDKNGKVHNINGSEDIVYKLKSASKMYAINFRTATYRSRRYVYQTNTIHHQTLSPQASWSSYGDKNFGEVKFFQCDVKSEESAKKIVTKYCNQNNCYAYLLVSPLGNFEDNFDEVITDVGAENILKVSDYKDLMKKSRSRGSSSGFTISNDDIFLIGNSSDGLEGLEGNLNDSEYLRKVDVENLDEDEDIIYVPITRYASNDGFMPINEIYLNLGIHNDIFADKKVYAIKTSSVKKFSDYNLIAHNEYVKNEIVEKMQECFDKYAEIQNLLDFCREVPYGSTYSTNDWQHLLWGIVNLFGKNYHKYLNKTLTSTIDMMITYESLKMSNHTYVDIVNRTLKKIGCPQTHEQIQKTVENNSLYVSFADKNGIDIKYNNPLKYSIPSIQKLEKIAKAELDKSPLVKYNVSVAWKEVSTSNHVQENPVNASYGYWSRNGRNEWATTFSDSDLEVLRVTLGNSLN